MQAVTVAVESLVTPRRDRVDANKLAKRLRRQVGQCRLRHSGIMFELQRGDAVVGPNMAGECGNRPRSVALYS